MKILGIEKPIIGMIHTDASPGTSKYNGDVKSIISKALSEAEIYTSAGIDVIMIENMHDVPYLNRTTGPEVTSLLAIISYEIKNKTGLPVGIQILAGANRQAISAALVSGADFIRAEGFVFGHVADEGYFDSDAGDLLRFRKSIGAENVKIFTDIKKKHSSHAITSDVNILETAKAAEFFLSDGLIITGTSTGKQPLLEEIVEVKNNVNIPVIAGSGITSENFGQYFPYCDAFIVGSYFKKDGNWLNSVEVNKVRSFMDQVNKLK